MVVLSDFYVVLNFVKTQQHEFYQARSSKILPSKHQILTWHVLQP